MAKAKRNSKGSKGANRNLTEQFIEKYKNKSDVSETDTGLLVRIIEQVSEPSAKKPDEFDSVKVHQRIMLADGSVIDDTYKVNLPETYSMAEAIPGLREGLAMMGIGDRFEFVIPPDLAWGKKGNGSKIGPNALMKVDIRLLDFE